MRLFAPEAHFNYLFVLMQLEAEQLGKIKKENDTERKRKKKQKKRKNRYSVESKQLI